MLGNIRRVAARGCDHARPSRRLPVRLVVPRFLLFLLLTLLAAVSTSRASGDSVPAVSGSRTEVVAAHDGVDGPSCRDLRDAELILAQQEIRLLDQLASRGAGRDAREALMDELDATRASLDDLDRALADARCPPPSRGG